MPVRRHRRLINQQDVAKLEEDLAVPHDTFLDVCMEVSRLAAAWFLPAIVKIARIQFWKFAVCSAYLSAVLLSASRSKRVQMAVAGRPVHSVYEQHCLLHERAWLLFAPVAWQILEAIDESFPLSVPPRRLGVPHPVDQAARGHRQG